MNSATSAIDSDVAIDDLASDAAYMRALTESLEYKVDGASEAAACAETLAHDASLIRRAMLSLATAYDVHLGQSEHRVEQCYQTLNNRTKTNLYKSSVIHWPSCVRCDYKSGVKKLAS
jgi:hypothetical protein